MLDNKYTPPCQIEESGFYEQAIESFQKVRNKGIFTLSFRIPAGRSLIFCQPSQLDGRHMILKADIGSVTTKPWRGTSPLLIIIRVDNKNGLMVLVMVVLVDIECSFTFRFRFISDRLIIMRFWLKRQRDRVGNYSISPLNIDKSPRYSCSTPVNKFGQFWIATSLLWTDTFTHFCYLLMKSVIISWDAYYAKKYTLTQCKEGARYVIFVLFGNFILQIILTVYRQLVLRMLKLLFQFHPYSIQLY